jgi:hypothetical protein
MVKAPTIIVDTGDVYKDLNIKLPDAYGGERSKLRHFWLHVEPQLAQIPPTPPIVKIKLL